MRRLLLLVCLVQKIEGQGFFNLAQSFLGSGLGGNNGGGGFLGNGAAFGGLLQNFAGTGNHAGPGSNLPFGEFFKMAPMLLGGAGGAPPPAAGLFQSIIKPPAPPRPAPGPAPAARGGPSLVPDSSDYNEPLPDFSKKAPPKPKHQPPPPKPQQHRPPPAPKPAPKVPPPVPQGADYDDIDYELTGANRG